MSNWKVRAAGVLLLFASLWYLPWAFGHLNRGALWLSIPFAAASLLTIVMSMVTVINHWSKKRSSSNPVSPGDEPAVAVVIPTYGEPPAMVYDTARSVLDQDYPQDKVGLVISDDGHRVAIRFLVQRLKQEYPEALIHYHEP